MINRENWKAMKRFLAYRRDVEQVSDSTVRLDETWLRHALDWAQEKSFADAPKIKPPFSKYLLSARRDGKDEDLSEAYLNKVVRFTRRFFEWLQVHESGYKSLTAAYLDSLKLPRIAESPIQRQSVTLDEVRALAQAEARNLREERIRAAAAFLFLSGMRVSAFTTLPLEAVELQSLTVKQWPNLGVRTKNGKHATTYLLNIPDLLAVVRAWDDFLRSQGLPSSAPWFAELSPVSGELDYSATVDDVGNHRDVRVRRDLKRFCNRVGLPYYSPHKFRHGNAEYALSQADDIGDLKAISQNLMHSNLSVTDEIYAVLSDDAMRDRINRLGQHSGRSEDIVGLLRHLADEIEQSKRGM